MVVVITVTVVVAVAVDVTVIGLGVTVVVVPVDVTVDVGVLMGYLLEQYDCAADKPLRGARTACIPLEHGLCATAVPTMARTTDEIFMFAEFDNVSYGLMNSGSPITQSHHSALDIYTRAGVVPGLVSSRVC